ncbi:aminotransferase class I/II-fold pyridoxal phosphate-dependent enzyme [Phaeacidiphilus oryzae]|uniref:aminotransferase class I/II-fold pyridoxal phosphate-dependent enzyme n=1 Tax=Phaeacidiphilus oryzae TaxID=348818 RepID=UPI0005618BFC|nr:aminotransferase class I/II-fold pyridoxal phosphate-dependent enzyme [Phaeacidiphilus oryzae]
MRGRRAADIAADVERAVGAGELAPGAALPPLRELAGELGVNPNTVAAAYRLLRDRGVIETAGRRGTRVRPKPAVTSRDEPAMPVPEGVRDLSTGNPAVDLLPDPAPALAAAAAAQAGAPVRYGAPAADPRLVQLARESFRADGIPNADSAARADAHPNSRPDAGSEAGPDAAPGTPPGGPKGPPIAVASGTLDGIERILAARLRPGDAVAVEDPGWASLLDLLPALGLRTVPVAVDDQGPLPEAVGQALGPGRARALIVTSRAQNPTSAALSAERAEELRALLREHQRSGGELLLLEDDHGHGIVDLPFHPLAWAPGEDGGPLVRHWAVARSAAKALGPDLRVAVITGDADTVERLRGRQRLGPGWVSHLLQRATAELWAASDPAAVAAEYRRRAAGLLDPLAAAGVRAHGRSGLNVWIPVADETRAVTGLLQRGWAVAAGARFRLSSGPGIRVTTAELAEPEAARLAADLVAVLTGRAPVSRGV